ncbi:MAG: alpha/beta hydrolase [Actinomycetota bacterium]
MPHWFLSTRAHSVGGPVSGDVKVIDSDRLGFIGDLTPELVAAVRGQEVFFAVHGFNVNQKHGIEHLNFWLENVDIGNAVKIGVLWPGDCFIPIFVDYVVEGHEAIRSGQMLSEFLNKNFNSAAALSFASHSLGARVVLQTISGLNRSSVHRVLLMAGAIDNNCLTNEYTNAANKVEQISLLASIRDAVLAAAFPLGNPIQGIIDSGHPYYHAALGREGPTKPDEIGSRLHLGWQIPKELGYGHLDYLPGQAIPAKYPQPCQIPPAQPVPPSGTPAQLAGHDSLWKPAFSAGFATCRYK